VSEHDFISALEQALDHSKPDTAALASAVVSRFGLEMFAARVGAVIGRFQNASVIAANDSAVNALAHNESN
jgi:hypothetical protein